ncbi:MAG: baseplate J/gp47 family protein [Flavobacteriaceae bacterium]|nr:baseplate J/gp47 family protein [Flavobacteriaceae bacterium]
MSHCDIDIATHKRTASSQSGRMPNALRTDFVAVDERTIADLIVSTNTLSRHINYYNKDNVLLDTWDTFFQWETTAILAQIANLDIAKYLSDFQLKRRELLFVPVLADQQEIILPFFQGIGDQVQDLFKKVAHLPSDFDLKEYLVGTQTRLELLLDSIETELAASTDLLYTLQHHLFNKNIQNFFGLLTQWKNKSEAKLYDNLENYPEHSPQYALYLAFLKLFGFAQEHLNEYTQRHLDFYYRKILRLMPEGARPDHVHLCIEPHKLENLFLLEAGSIFKAGKDSEGNEKYYSSTGDLVVNQAKIATIYGASKKSNVYYFQDSTERNAAGASWKPFPQETVFGDIGFAVASPMLFLRGGNRLIQLTFTNGDDTIVEVSPTDYDFYLSGEESWYQAEVYVINDKTILSVPSEEKAIVPFDPEIHEGVSLNTEFPVLKIVPKDGELKQKSFQKIRIEVLVIGYNHFKLFSDSGEIDHSKSYQPFGAVPRNGNGIVFSCKEYFQKKGALGLLVTLTDAAAQWWEQNTRLSFLENGAWTAGDKGEGTYSWYLMTNTMNVPYDFSENTPVTPDDATGFAKIILDSDSYEKEEYMRLFITASRTEATLPYLPTVTETHFHYYAEETLQAGGSADADYQFFHLYPRGYRELKGSSLRILPKIENEGELIIGISGLQGGNSVSLLFQVAEGSANPRQTPIDLTWKYLLGTEWKDFNSEDFGDDTNGLTQSGIIKLNSPEDLKWEEQTEYPAGIWWIRIEAKERIDAICDLVGIHTQALKAELIDFAEVGTQFIENTPAKTISKLFKTRNEVKKIEQPYPSFGGKLEEDDDLFYQRTSERLRHKGRAISIWDYEKLILDHFPEVFQVKCLNHHRYDSAELSNTSAGYVTIIPVAKGGTLDVPDYWKPIVDLGTMKRIETFLKERATPHARIAVKPPTLEKLELQFKVKYIDIPGADTNLYKQQLQDVINNFLSPWAFNDEVVADFQEEIEKSRLIQLIEHQSFVDYLTDFKVNHIILKETSDEVKLQMNDVEEIIPKTAYSLFVPHTHKIDTLTEDCCS